MLYHDSSRNKKWPGDNTGLNQNAKTICKIQTAAVSLSNICRQQELYPHTLTGNWVYCLTLAHEQIWWGRKPSSDLLRTQAAIWLSQEIVEGSESVREQSRVKSDPKVCNTELSQHRGGEKHINQSPPALLKAKHRHTELKCVFNTV